MKNSTIMSHSGTYDSRVYFNAEGLAIKPAYVSFVDIMGMATAMALSLRRSANFMGRFHVALLSISSMVPKCKVYPVMDGAYVVSDNLRFMLTFLHKLFEYLSLMFVNADDLSKCFLIRGSIAYGDVVLGADINKQVSIELSDDDLYKRNLLMGVPVAHAFLCADKAPPYGIFIDDTIRARQDSKMSGIWYRWWSKMQENIAKKVGLQLERYFKWTKERCDEIMYNLDKQNAHESLARQYWSPFYPQNV